MRSQSPSNYSRLVLLALCFCINTLRANDALDIPEPMREFRGAWIASVGNIDWPSAKGLPVEQQKKELIGMLDRAVALKLNAIILQVRPVCDALYDSKLEPWSEYLTGEIGRPPQPFYDPLQFAVDEAHKRGLELHAWFNPYRAGILASKSKIPENHISKAHPELVRTYGKFLWLDPGEPGVQEHSLNVIMDVVKRYDVDGIHFDDYFYPYQERGKDGKLLDFPDDRSWKRYQEAGGKMSRNDWRRENVNYFLRNCYQSIKAEKPWVKFGISPFGIWKPGNPKQIVGLNSYESLYADSRKWLMEGWLDYFAPQLYWNIADVGQSYPVLQKWWVEQNKLKRHMWIGISTQRVGSTRGPDEIAKQILLTRQEPGTTGNIHWSVKSLVRNQKGVADLLAKEVYDQPALVPASTWLDDKAPGRPSLNVRQSGQNVHVAWRSSGFRQKAWQWAVQTRTNGKWETEVFPSGQQSMDIQTTGQAAPDIIVVRAVDRCANLSPVAVAQFRNGKWRD